MNLKTVIALVFLSSSFSVFASDLKLHCKVRQNSDVLVDTDVTLSKGQRNKVFGHFDGFEFILSDNGNDVIELQSFNMYEPARIYATATLTAPGSLLEVSVWKREYLLEVKCIR